MGEERGRAALGLHSRLDEIEHRLLGAPVVELAGGAGALVARHEVVGAGGVLEAARPDDDPVGERPAGGVAAERELLHLRSRRLARALVLLARAGLLRHLRRARGTRGGRRRRGRREPEVLLPGDPRGGGRRFRELLVVVGIGAQRPLEVAVGLELRAAPAGGHGHLRLRGCGARGVVRRRRLVRGHGRGGRGGRRLGGDVHLALGGLGLLRLRRGRGAPLAPVHLGAPEGHRLDGRRHRVDEVALGGGGELGQADAAQRRATAADPLPLVGLLVLEGEHAGERRGEAVVEAELDDLAVLLRVGALAEQAPHLLHRPEARDQRGADAIVQGDRVLAREVLAAEPPLHGRGGRQRVVRAREEDDLLAPRDFAAHGHHRLVEPGAEIDGEIGDGRRLDGAREAEDLGGRALDLVDAEVLPAAEARELAQQAVVGVGADAHGEEARARGRERAAHPLGEPLPRDLARRGQTIADVDDGGLLLAVHPAERDVEERAQIRGAARRVLGEPLQRHGDLLLRRLGEPVLRVEDGGGGVERDQREVIRRRHGAEDRLGGGRLLLARRLVRRRRGVDDDDEVAGQLLDRAPVDVGDVARHEVVGAVLPRGEAGDAEGLLGAAGPGERRLELEVGPGLVAAAAHRHPPARVLDHGVGERRDRRAPAGVAEIDDERELADLDRIGGAHRVEVGDLAVARGEQLHVAQHHAPRARGRHRVDAGAVAPAVDPLEERGLVRGADGGLVARRRLLPLDDLALDEDAVGLDGERGDHRPLGDGEPVPALDLPAAGVREGLVDLGLGQTVAKDGADRLPADLEGARGRAGGAVAIDAVDPAGARAVAAEGAVVAHAAGPVLPVGERGDLGRRAGGDDRLLARVHLDAPSRRDHDGEPARDVDGDGAPVALHREPGLRGRDGDVAELVREAAALGRRRVEPHLARGELEPGLAQDDLGVAAQEHRRAVGEAGEGARPFARRELGAGRKRDPRDHRGGGVAALDRHLAGGELEARADGARLGGRRLLPAQEQRDARDQHENADRHPEGEAVPPNEPPRRTRRLARHV